MSQENEMKLSIGKLIFILIIIFLLVSGGTYAFWNWESFSEQWTNIAFLIENEELGYSCSADGGGQITANEVVIMPSSCDNNNNVIVREITTSVEITGDNISSVTMDLWLNVNQLSTSLSESQNFKYVVTNSSTSCTEGVIATGSFNGKTTGDKVDIISSDVYKSTGINRYYLYIWLDQAEKNPATANQTFNFSLGGTCVGHESTFDDHTPMITSYTCKDADGNDVTVGDNPYFTYTGECEVVDDGNGDWRIKFLTSGTFTSKLNIPVDAFLVGGGGGGGYASGGGGGYTTTKMGIIIESSTTSYEIVVGEGGVGSGTDGNTVGADGGISSAFNVTVNGGGGGGGGYGGEGGSGGGFGSYPETVGDGGSDGSNGMVASGGGTGQGITTREFGEPDGTLYAGGGAGYGGSPGDGGGGAGSGGNGQANTGGGGGEETDYGAVAGSGGSGIVIIRNSRKANLGFDFEYTGVYTVLDDGDGNWRIRFLTSGTFTSSVDMYVDAFLVGGGGGGTNLVASGSGGGGGGGYTTTTLVNINKDVSYDIVVGSGGVADSAGGDTTGFGSIAFGGEAGNGSVGGSGGNGGTAGIDGATGASQRENTYEFGDTTSILYSTGGTGGGSSETAAVGNSGSGGGGSPYAKIGGGTGGSGIVVIRNSSSEGVDVDFEYTGSYVLIDDGNGNWRIKFLTDGTFKPASNLSIDVFLVGGGGGGVTLNVNGTGAGGDGGYTTVSKSVSVNANGSYDIVIGAGGAGGSEGSATTGFNLSANGGSGGTTVDRSTYEFGEDAGTIYSKAGASGGQINGAFNTGDGGGGSPYAKTGGGNSGGSGVVIIRNAR